MILDDDIAPPLQHRTIRRRIPRNEYGEAADHYAPYSGARVCHSLAGRWRPAHVHVGGACIFCGHREGWVPLRERICGSTKGVAR